MAALIIFFVSWISKVWFLSKSVLTAKFLFSAKLLALIFFNLFKRVYLCVVKFAQWRKKWATDSILFPQLHKRSSESWILCLNLCFFNWLKPILRCVRNFSPNGLFMLKILMQFGLMKFKCFLKNLQRSRIANLKIKLAPLTYYWWKKKKKNFEEKLLCYLSFL